jgi:hypothetical protein
MTKEQQDIIPIDKRIYSSKSSGRNNNPANVHFTQTCQASYQAYKDLPTREDKIKHNRNLANKFLEDGYGFFDDNEKN